MERFRYHLEFNVSKSPETFFWPIQLQWMESLFREDYWRGGHEDYSIRHLELLEVDISKRMRRMAAQFWVDAAELRRKRAKLEIGFAEQASGLLLLVALRSITINCLQVRIIEVKAKAHEVMS
jgi:hypothetical protein